QTYEQAPHSMQSKILCCSAFSNSCALLNQYSCCGSRSAGQASTHRPQRIQAMAISLGGSSCSVGASRQLLVLVIGSCSCGRANPIIGPPIITRSRCCTL